MEIEKGEMRCTDTNPVPSGGDLVDMALWLCAGVFVFWVLFWALRFAAEMLGWL